MNRKFGLGDILIYAGSGISLIFAIIVMATNAGGQQIAGTNLRTPTNVWAIVNGIFNLIFLAGQAGLGVISLWNKGLAKLGMFLAIALFFVNGPSVMFPTFWIGIGQLVAVVGFVSVGVGTEMLGFKTPDIEVSVKKEK